MERRDLLLGTAAVSMAAGRARRPMVIDFGAADRRHEWLHHPAIGDPSWDAFEREPGNPIYIGREPYLWPVNGFLFRDPPSGRWHAYVSLYPRGYWPPPPLNSVILRERDTGGWEELGPVFRPDPRAYNGDGKASGGMTDVSVLYDGGRYHLLFGWCDPRNQHGGLGYAYADRPEGPFHCADRPIHDEVGRPMVLGRYARAYASTLFRRQRDWLILHMMSAPGNGGGTWGLFCMTAASPDGPYVDPQPLLYPQSDRFHPPLAEFYPAFLHDGHIYAPATSVAANRSFQTLFCAPLADAHKPGSWRIAELGSLWHAEAMASEARGIWGQTFAGQVGADGALRVLFPSKTIGDVGTIGMARRPWGRPFRDGFVLGAPNAPAFGILRPGWGEFHLATEIEGSGPYAIAWGCSGPLGPDHPLADSRPHPFMRRSRVEWRRSADAWLLVAVDGKAGLSPIADGRLATPPARRARVEITCRRDFCEVRLAGEPLWSGPMRMSDGRVEIVAETGSIVRVLSFSISGTSRAVSECWLSSEALAGAASAPDEWQVVEDAQYRFGVGHSSLRAGSRAKWNIVGRVIRLWSPRGPGCGTAEVKVDGRPVANIDLQSTERLVSAPVLERRLPPGRHAVVIQARSSGVPCDCLDVLP